MKIKFLKDANYPQNDPENSRSYKAGETYDVPDDHGQRWIRRNAAVEVTKKAKAEAAEASEDEEEPTSPVHDLTVEEAQDRISRMTSTAKLEAIIDSDKRKGVHGAAEKRLEELTGTTTTDAPATP
jgi:hypothetical protein